MINPRSYNYPASLAYEPYLAFARAMVIVKDREWRNDISIAQYSGMPVCFFSHHDHIELEIVTFGFDSMDEARSAVLDLMWNIKGIFNTSCLCDSLTDEQFEWFKPQLKGLNDENL